MKKLFALLLACVLILGTFAGCGQTQDDQTSKVLNIATLGETTLMYPVYMIAENFGVDKIVFETLVNYENGELVPALATKWEHNEDYTEWTIAIREGIKFHDGEPLNAEAVVKNLDDWRHGILATTYMALQGASTWDTCEAISEYEVKITYPAGYYFVMNDFCWSDVTPIVSPKEIEKNNDEDEATVPKPVGTGPYTYGEFVVGEKTTFLKNESYWNGEVAFDEIVAYYIPDESTRLQALQNGEIDMIYGSPMLSFDAYNTALEYPNVDGKIFEKPSTQRNLTLNFNGILGDKTIREALAYAINQEEIVTGVCNGYEKVSKTVNTPGGLFENSETSVKYSFDAEKSKSLLESAGWTDSDNDGIREKDGNKLSVKITYPSEDASQAAIAQVIKTQLANVGIELIIEEQDAMTWMYSFYDMENLTNYDLTFQSTYADYATPVLWFANLGMMAQMRSLGLLEDAETFNANCAAIRTSTDKAELKEIIDYLTVQSQDQYLDIPLVTNSEIVLFNTQKISDYEMKNDRQFFDPLNVIPAK